MPIRIPQGLYTGGRAVINPGKAANNIATGILEEKAAKDAILKNIQDLNSKLNLAGVREQDRKDAIEDDGTVVPGIDNMINQFVEQGSKGKLDMPLYNKIRFAIEDSKQYTNLAKTVKDGIDKGLTVDELDVDFMDKLNSSVLSKKSRKDNGLLYSETDIPAAIKYPETIDYKRHFDASREGVMPKYDAKVTKTDKVSGRAIMTYKYDDDQIRDISANAAVYMDQSLTKGYKKMMKNKALVDKYQPILQKYFPGETIDSPEKMAMAVAAERASQFIEEKDIDDPAVAKEAAALRRKHDREMEDRKHKHKKELKKMGSGGGSLSGGDVVGYYEKNAGVSATVTNASKFPNGEPFASNGTSITKIYRRDIDQGHYDVITSNGGIAGYEDERGNEYFISYGGKLYGEDGVVIDRGRVKDDYLKKYKTIGGGAIDDE